MNFKYAEYHKDALVEKDGEMKTSYNNTAQGQL